MTAYRFSTVQACSKPGVEDTVKNKNDSGALISRTQYMANLEKDLLVANFHRLDQAFQMLNSASIASFFACLFVCFCCLLFCLLLFLLSFWVGRVAGWLAD